jgi:ABC-type amino acid transport substrate-binding protein
MSRPIAILMLCCVLIASAIASDTTTVAMLIAERVDANNHVVDRNTVSRKIIEYLAQKSGVHIELHPYPWKRALMLAESGESAIWGLSRTPEREHIFNFSHPVFSKNIWMIVRNDHIMKINTIADLAGRRISIFRGASYGAEFEKARTNNLFTVEEDTNSWEIRFSKLLAGRCDVMLASATSATSQKAAQFFENYGYDPRQMSILDKPLFADTLYIAILKSQSALFPMDAINAAIDAGRGDIERLMEE